MKIGHKHTGCHRAARARSYPSIGDQLDAIAKGLAAYRDGGKLPPETLDWLDQVQSVKERFRPPDPD